MIVDGNWCSELYTFTSSIHTFFTFCAISMDENIWVVPKKQQISYVEEAVDLAKILVIGY